MKKNYSIFLLFYINFLACKEQSSSFGYDDFDGALYLKTQRTKDGIKPSYSAIVLSSNILKMLIDTIELPTDTSVYYFLGYDSKGQLHRCDNMISTQNGIVFNNNISVTQGGATIVGTTAITGNCSISGSLLAGATSLGATTATTLATSGNAALNSLNVTNTSIMGGKVTINNGGLTINTGGENITAMGTESITLTSAGTGNITLNNSGMGNILFTATNGNITFNLSNSVKNIVLPDTNKIVYPKNNTSALKIDSSGNITTTNSSKRYKTDIHDLSVNYEDFITLAPKMFTYIESGYLDYGLIAEDLLGTTFEVAIIYNTSGEVETINYQMIFIIMLQQLIEARKEIKMLQKKLSY